MNCSVVKVLLKTQSVANIGRARETKCTDVHYFSKKMFVAAIVIIYASDIPHFLRIFPTFALPLLRDWLFF